MQPGKVLELMLLYYGNPQLSKVQFEQLNWLGQGDD